MAKIFVACILLQCCGLILSEFTLGLGKDRHRNADEKQEYLLNTLDEFDITYPTEVDRRGKVTDHVTTLSKHRRRRRSANEDPGPIIYQVNYKGKTIKLVLKVNDKLFGSDFVVEWHRENGTIDRKRPTDNCFLIGETEPFHTSVAISDCDGLSGIIDLGQDSLYIEPVLNTTLISHRGWTGHGRPHLLYKKAALHRTEARSLEVEETAFEDYSRGLKEKETTSATRTASVETAYVEFVNYVNRAVKIFYIDGGEEKTFKVLLARQTTLVDTYTSHKWVVRDLDTGKQLYINKRRIFTPPSGSSLRRRSMAYITVPRGMRLPKAREPPKPNSHITFINKSPRFVKLYYIEEGETIFFLNLSPGEDMAVSTFTAHRWFAKDLDTGKILHVNGRNEYTPGRSNAHKRIKVYVTVPSTLSLPEMKFPDMLKTEPKYIEVMATADSSVLLYHGKDKSEKYILTLMNIVSRLFQHKSIGAPIYFVVVKLVLLEKDPKEIKITTKPMPSLKSVCHWGHKNRKGFDRLTKDYYDQTVFITRKDFGPSGYAPVYGMCYRVRSCTLNQEDGFTSAFIIAHETGHTLGMEHDGTNNNCSNDVIKGSIMAPLVRSQFDRFYWSPCSRRELLSKLSSLWCLNDAPFRNKIPYLAKLPGQIYTIDQQCRHDFGSNSRFCSSMGKDPCVELWCSQLTYTTYSNRFCQTRRNAALEGTKCAPNKWCRLGKCVPVDGKSFGIPLPRPTAKPVHGGWSDWSGLSECSRSCGVGVRHKERKCNNPSPKNNGKPCEGTNIEYELCNTKDCPGHLLTFEQSRDQQCKRLGPSVLPEGSGVWSMYDVFKADIACDFESDFCDWTNDPIDDTDWTRKKGRTPTSGTGPSRDHTVGEHGHYVFFETSRPVAPGWRARLVSKHIGMRIACLKFWYHAFGENVHMGELQLVVRSGLEEKIAWSVNQNRGDRWIVKYASIFSKKPYQLIFQGIRGDGYLSDFALDDISLTPGSCGIGRQRLLTINNEISLNPCRQFCKLKKDELGAKTVEVEVENGTRCYDRLSSFDVCIRGKCQEIGCDGALGSNKVLDTCGVCGGNNQSCLSTKGSINILPKEDMQTLMECPVGATNILLEDTSPNFLVLAAMGEDKPVINGAEEQSSTSVYEIAGAKFTYKREGNKEAVSTLGPIKDRLVVKVKMNEKPTQMELHYQFFKPKNNGVNYYWSHYKWSHCSQTCGEGIQTRIFKCRKQSDNTEATDVNCFSSHKPEPLTKSCNLTACERYEWQVANWSSCSAPCGAGNQSREVTCRGVLGRQVVNPALCTSEKPEARQLCNDEPCPAEWIIGNWSKCSRTCDNGIQNRLIICQDYRGARSLNCPKDSKPAGNKVCRNDPCIKEGPSVLQNMSCSFEEGFCHWTNVQNSMLEQFDWVLFNGSTPSRNTGPPHDHTLGTSEGVYAYIEASDPQQRNDRARLISPMVYARKVCFDFWYHMYGASMGWLRVIVKSPNVRERRLWYRSGNQGSEWINERLQIFSYLPYQIMIEGIRGKGFSSDAAVDDIKVTSGSCPAFDTPRSECKGDKSRYCKAAIRFNWCSSEKWGRICCKTCQDTVEGKQ